MPTHAITPSFHAPVPFMTVPELTVQDIEVFIDGTGPNTVVMIHGWPDTHRLWDATVETLKGQHRCVRFTLPGFDPQQPARATALTDMTALFGAIVQAVSPDQPVTLLLHDWGCILANLFIPVLAGRRLVDGTPHPCSFGRSHDTHDGRPLALPHCARVHRLADELPIRHAMVRPHGWLSRRGTR